jgi:hypothetical protein
MSDLQELKPESEPELKRYWRVHLILLQVDKDPKELDVDHNPEILEEEELAGYRADFENEYAARAIFSAFTGVDVRGGTKWDLVPLPTPDYQDLLGWLKAQGKTEQDYFKWLARADLAGFNDMPYQEAVDMLLQGIPAYDRAFCMEHWEGLDNQTRIDYRQYMLDAWAGGRVPS